MRPGASRAVAKRARTRVEHDDIPLARESLNGRLEDGDPVLIPDIIIDVGINAQEVREADLSQRVEDRPRAAPDIQYAGLVHDPETRQTSKGGIGKPPVQKSAHDTLTVHGVLRPLSPRPFGQQAFTRRLIRKAVVR